MANKKSDEFKRDAVRIAQTSGLTRRDVSADLGIGVSTLNKWIQQLGKEQVISAADLDLLQENEKLRRENRVLKEEREVLKKATAFFARQKT